MKLSLEVFFLMNLRWKIIPIYKKGDPSNAGNHRPVSMLSSFSKVFERALDNRIFHFLNMYAVLSEHEYMPLRPTQLAVCKAINLIVELILTRQKHLTTHKLLLGRLGSFGLRGTCPVPPFEGQKASNNNHSRWKIIFFRIKSSGAGCSSDQFSSHLSGICRTAMCASMPIKLVSYSLSKLKLMNRYTREKIKPFQ